MHETPTGRVFGRDPAPVPQAAHIIKMADVQGGNASHKRTG